MNRRLSFFLLGAGLLFTAGIVALISIRSDFSTPPAEDQASTSDRETAVPFEQVVELGTGSVGSTSTRDDSSTPPLEDDALKSDSEKEVPFEQVVELGTGSLPLRSQHAVAAWDGDPLTVFTDGGNIYVAGINGERYQVTTLGQISGPTIAASDDRVVVAWVTKNNIEFSSSTNLLDWSAPAIVDARVQDGASIPSIDWTGTEFALVWTDAPKIIESTGRRDGVGTLKIARGDGESWTVESINQTTVVVTIAGSTIVWRDDRAESGSQFDTVYMKDIYEGEEVVVVTGFDPAVAVDGEDIAIGYHVGAAAHLRTSIDGGATWTDTVLDSTGKFVAPMASDGVFGAVWVDYTDHEAAMNPRENTGQRVGVVWDGETYLMNEGATYTLQGQGTVIDGIPVSVYQVDGVIFLAY